MHSMIYPPLSVKAACFTHGFKKRAMNHRLSCLQGHSQRLTGTMKRAFFPSERHNKFSRVMIGVRARWSQRRSLSVMAGHLPISVHRELTTHQHYPSENHHSLTFLHISPPHLYLFLSPPSFPSVFHPSTSVPISVQTVRSVLIKAIGQAHHANCRWLQLNSSLWACNKSSGTGWRIHLAWH